MCFLDIGINGHCVYKYEIQCNPAFQITSICISIMSKTFLVKNLRFKIECILISLNHIKLKFIINIVINIDVMQISKIVIGVFSYFILLVIVKTRGNQQSHLHFHLLQMLHEEREMRKL